MTLYIILRAGQARTSGSSVQICILEGPLGYKMKNNLPMEVKSTVKEPIKRTTRKIKS
jgi:hypothetical protein